MSLSDYKKQHDLEEIEKKLAPIVKKKDKSWIEVYKLLDIVEEEQLYSVSYKSYTAWLTDFAARTNVTVSLLWKKKKAGTFYESYVDDRKYQNKPYIPIEQLDMDPEVIVMIEKITSGNLAEAHKMINRSLSGETKRSDLKTLWESEKKERAAKGIPIQRVNTYDKDTFTDFAYAGYASKNATNIDITSALCNEKWMYSLFTHQETRKYRLFTEFSIVKGRIETDYVIAENYTTKSQLGSLFHLHSVKIICDRDEFFKKPDFKAYPEYMDYYWLAVPSECREDAESYLKGFENIGLILYDEERGFAFIEKNAKNATNFGVKREATMDSIVYYLI